jgi:hypothetical protein
VLRERIVSEVESKMDLTALRAVQEQEDAEREHLRKALGVSS